MRDIVAAHLPGFGIDRVALLGEGWDNQAYAVNGALIVRFSKESSAARRGELVKREARILAAAARLSPLPVPELTFTVPELGCLAYMKLPGVQLLNVADADRSAHAASVGATLGTFLRAVHAAPVDEMASLVDPDDQPLAGWQTDAAELYQAVAGAIPEFHRRPIESFLATAPPLDAPALVFSHNDLGSEHVLVDPASYAITGILDWGDAALVDPAYDFGLIYRDLGPAALESALGTYQPADQAFARLRERAVFYARSSVFEDLAFGLAHGQVSYLEKSRRVLPWLFPG